MPLRITRKHAELASKWTPTAVAYGATAWLGLLYLTDWKVVVRYIPFYGSKFEEAE
ncbi:cytochrome b-c1 complex subunit 10-like [Temnothorax curvispinosus]|uniref:Cytochrome b-c1 complex subunit 10-like n=1 Tax=Temnothorax curvispinosus TaxID=300111 RepID=A0A6J1QZ05_9HYME|nr:cytochrome b-c1 complex subunit 10-like [Temnothorax curvispinosus]